MDGYTMKDLAQIAGYTYRRLHDIDMALPEKQKLFVKREDGKYDLALFVQRWVSYNKEQADEAEGRSLEEIKALHEAVKKRKTELEVAQMEGTLVDVQDVRKLWGDISNTVMQRMIRIPTKVAPSLLGIENVEMIASMIDREIRDGLCEIAETPVPEYVPNPENDETEE